MIESVLHFFKVHRKVIFGNPPIIVENMFGKTPKPFNAIDVISAAKGKGFAVIQPVMLAPSFQRIVTAECVGVIDGSFSRLLSDDGHKLLFAHLFHNASVYPPIPLQKAKDNTFPSRAPAASAFSSAAKIGLVHLNLAIQLFAFKLSHMIQRLAQMLIDANHRLVIQLKIRRQSIGRLLLIEAADDRDFFPQLFQRFLFFTSLLPTTHVAAFRFAYFERSTKNAFSAPQKVGRTTERGVFSRNHKDILPSFGYESN